MRVPSKIRTGICNFSNKSEINEKMIIDKIGEIKSRSMKLIYTRLLSLLNLSIIIVHLMLTLYSAF